jgi:hypothetical protein
MAMTDPLHAATVLCALSTWRSPRRTRSLFPRSRRLPAAGAAAQPFIRSINLPTDGQISSAMRPRPKRRLSALASAKGVRSWTLGAWPGGTTSRSAPNTHRSSPSCSIAIQALIRSCPRPPAGRDEPQLHPPGAGQGAEGLRQGEPGPARIRDLANGAGGVGAAFSERHRGASALAVHPEMGALRPRPTWRCSARQRRCSATRRLGTTRSRNLSPP